MYGNRRRYGSQEYALLLMTIYALAKGTRNGKMLIRWDKINNRVIRKVVNDFVQMTHYSSCLSSEIRWKI